MIHSEHKALQPLWWLLYFIVVEGITIGTRYIAVAGGFSFPFFWIAIYSVLGFIAASIYFMVETVKNFDGPSSKFYLRPGDYLPLTLITAGEHCLSVLALSYSTMTIGTYIMLFQVQYLFQLVLSAIFFRRRPSLMQVAAVFVILGSIAVFVLVTYTGVGVANTTFPSFVTLQAWGYVWGAALCRSGRSALAGYMQQRRLQDDESAPHRSVAVPAMRAIYSTAQFDTSVVSFNTVRTLETELMGGLAGLCPIALTVSFFTSEAPSSFTQIYFIPWLSWICFGLMAVGLVCAPMLRARVILGSSPRAYAAVTGAGAIAAVITGALALGEILTVTQIVGLAVLGFGTVLWHFSQFPPAFASIAAVVNAASGEKSPEATDAEAMFATVGPVEPTIRGGRVGPAPEPVTPALAQHAAGGASAFEGSAVPDHNTPLPADTSSVLPHQASGHVRQPSVTSPHVSVAPAPAVVALPVPTPTPVHTRQPSQGQHLPSSHARQPSVTLPPPAVAAAAAITPVPATRRTPSIGGPVAIPPPPALPSVPRQSLARPTSLPPPPPLSSLQTPQHSTSVNYGTTPLTASAVTPRVGPSPASVSRGGRAAAPVFNPEEEAGDAIDFSSVSATDREK